MLMRYHGPEDHRPWAETAPHPESVCILSFLLIRKNKDENRELGELSFVGNCGKIKMNGKKEEVFQEER